MKMYLIIFGFLFVSCKTVELNSNETFSANSNETVFLNVIYGYKSINTVNDQLQKNFSVEQIEMAKNVLNSFEDIEFELLCDSKKSVFYIIDKLNFKDDINYKIASITAGKNKIYYNNLITDEIFYEKNIEGEKFYIQEENSKDKWILTRETKQIDNYTCYKAYYPRKIRNPRTEEVQTVNVIAWYTPEIPYSFGPVGLSGLPGLIMEASLTGGKTIYFVKSFSNSNESGIDFPTNVTTISKEEYENMYKKRVEQDN